MTTRRFLSFIAVSGLSFALWTTWVQEHPPKASPAETVNQSVNTGFDAPPVISKASAVTTKAQTPQLPAHKKVHDKHRIHVKTDVLALDIDAKTGDITQSQLLQYTKSVNNPTALTLLNTNQKQLYRATSGLQLQNGQVAKIHYQANQTDYTLAPGAHELTVTLKGTTADQSIAVIKTFTLARNAYAVRVKYQVKNLKNTQWQGRFYKQLIRKKVTKNKHLFEAHSYEGASMSSHQHPYEKVTFNQMAKANVDRTHAGGWIAMQQLYFLSAWVPHSQLQHHHFYTKSQPIDQLYMIGLLGPDVTIAPRANHTFSAILYTGPELTGRLAQLAPGLDRTVDYGWLWWISSIIFWLMSSIHAFIGNWGWAIVMTTIIIKFLLYPLSAASFRSMAKMRELQPKIQALKERYGDDRQALSRATMELYQKEKINPIGGCLPMLIQVPIFIGLYYVIIESVQLRQAPFLGWIVDLSVRDPYFILPILMGISMLIQQRLTPSAPDPAQAKMMMVVPVVFTVFFINFPAGLTLYWLVNNVVQILQQWYVTQKTKGQVTHSAHKKRRKKSK